MNDSFHENLSADFDGERDAAERKAAPLPDTPAAQEIRRDYAELSGWLKDLPRLSAPTDLLQAVLNECGVIATDNGSSANGVAVPNRNDQRLPTATVTGTATAARPAGIPGDIPAGRKWSVSIVLSGLVAAAIVVLFSLNKPSSPDHTAIVADNADTNARAEAEFQGVEEESDGSRNTEVDVAMANGFGATGSNAPGEAAVPAMPQATKPAGTLGLRNAPNENAPEQFAKADGQPGFAGDGAALNSMARELALPPEFAGSPLIGNLMRLQAAGDEGVVVVELTVVDVERTLDGLQLLLAENSIPPARRDPKREAKSGMNKTEPGEPSTRQESRLRAVYVQATQEQLANSLHQLVAQKLAQHVDLGGSVNMTTESPEILLAQVQSKVLDRYRQRPFPEDKPRNRIARPMAMKSATGNLTDSPAEPAADSISSAGSPSAKNAIPSPMVRKTENPEIAAPAVTARPGNRKPADAEPADEAPSKSYQLVIAPRQTREKKATLDNPLPERPQQAGIAANTSPAKQPLTPRPAAIVMNGQADAKSTPNMKPGERKPPRKSHPTAGAATADLPKGHDAVLPPSQRQYRVVFVLRTPPVTQP